MSTERWRKFQDCILLQLFVITNIIVHIYLYWHLNDVIYHFEQISRDAYLIYCL